MSRHTGFHQDYTEADKIERMSKAQEIRGYIRGFIEGVMTDVSRAKGLSEGMLDWDVYLLASEEELVNKLHSQGVVIKVGRKLPDERFTYSTNYSRAIQQEMLNTGNVDIVPLVDS